jgi:hypothetical protein
MELLLKERSPIKATLSGTVIEVNLLPSKAWSSITFTFPGMVTDVS